MSTDIDARAKKILFDTHWTAKGWIDASARSVSPADRAYAVQHGTMFDLLTITHDALVAELVALASEIDLATSSAHFLVSLNTRRLDLRSGLASHVLAQGLRAHAFVDGGGGHCATCRGRASYVDEDLDVLNFERHKWGGVRHGDPVYMRLDLRELARAGAATPNDSDRNTLRLVLKTVELSSPRDRATTLSKQLTDVLKSTKQERDALLEILAASGVLAASDASRGCGEFVWAGPWRGADGYDRAAVTRLFGMHGVTGA